MNRFRLVDEVSIYLLGSNNCHITLLYFHMVNSVTYIVTYFTAVNFLFFKMRSYLLKV